FCLQRARVVLFFFFSSRRRHTRWPRDWSSDVCSSDLTPLVVSFQPETPVRFTPATHAFPLEPAAGGRRCYDWPSAATPWLVLDRSEERRVGKECRSRGWPYADERTIERGSARKSLSRW